MSDAQRWNQRFADAKPPAAPCTALSDFAYLLPDSGLALDLASGLGGNAVFLARRGLVTQAWDISDVALAKLTQYAADHALPLTTRVADLENTAIPVAAFDLITVSRYLYRPLCAGIMEALRPGGILVYQTFMANKLASTGPSNPDYLLGSNELLDLFRGLQILAYREEDRSWGDLARGDRNLATLVAARRLD